MSDTFHSRWEISQGQHILSRRFGEQYAIYLRGSGDTHLLHNAGYFILQALDNGPRSFEDLLSKLCAEYEFSSAEQSQELLTSIILEFQKLSIIQRFDT